ncbi:nicotinate-nucleotide adenylyltransferase [Virgibacillus sp. C22-A2]|uniref:Probable nicotinate-nucleotide adenylyltransferase n=1 Tax=Virgibacillus tibetensis TaxID=3042313 RepID=A0ABU6KA31_9BACI|nr:nicotinate-nucleotide adenylyltransferase [Virgibacillus sp. C22-A2]
MKRVGILGGTFDPPHLGHLIIGEEVRLALNLEEIWFVPSHLPPHKESAKTSATDRINMLMKALDGNSFFSINTIETERLGKSYTFDTIKALQKEFPDTEFYFIIGADMVEYLQHWHRIDELINMVSFVGVKRAGYKLHSAYPIIEVDIPAIEISSTLIRDRLSTNETVRYLMPETVYTYIKEKQLYES